MPPASSSKQPSSSQFYPSDFTPSQRPEAKETTQALSPFRSAESNSNTQQKKKYICPTCERPFSTSGHLSRHSRVHTGERNHRCPFPGCDTRCSRQDNLQQHYRIHLVPGSRRGSTRPAIARAINQPSRRATSQPQQSSPQGIPSISSPPPLEPALVYGPTISPPNSPPPLAQATLSATANIYPAAQSRGSSPSPESSYPSSLPHMPMASPMPLPTPSYSHYTHSPTAYQTFHNGFPFTQEHGRDSYDYHEHPTYPGSHSIPHINTSLVQPKPRNQDSPMSSSSMSSSTSISHLSLLHQSPSYPRSAQRGGTAPPSPASSRSNSSHASGGPSTPTLAPCLEKSSYHRDSLMIAEQRDVSHLSSLGFNEAGQRFDSPPPVPIQDSRLSQYLQHYQITAYESHSHYETTHESWKLKDIRNKAMSTLIR